MSEVATDQTTRELLIHAAGFLEGLSARLSSLHMRLDDALRAEHSDILGDAADDCAKIAKSICFRLGL